MDTLPFPVDEGPLRDSVLKAYHEKHGESGTTRGILDAIRQFLSGPPGVQRPHFTYRFEEFPEGSVASFLEDLEKAFPDLPRTTIGPLLAAVEQSSSNGAGGAPLNVPVWLASLAGSLSVRTGLDETLTSAILSAAVLGMSRLGTAPFRTAMAGGSRGAGG
jgi:hypothetical protein